MSKHDLCGILIIGATQAGHFHHDRVRVRPLGSRHPLNQRSRDGSPGGMLLRGAG
jgi:hypothetical protein